MEERFLGTGAVQPDAEHREPPELLTRIAKGLVRFTAFALAAAAIAGGAGALWAALSGNDVARGISVGLYVGGALLVLLAVFSFSNAPRQWSDQYGSNLGATGGGDLGAYLSIGLALILLGLAVDSVF